MLFRSVSQSRYIGTADALATALVVDGRDAVNWMGNEEFRNYSFWAVDRNGDQAWSYARP